MPIQVNNNTDYGGNLIDHKSSPLVIKNMPADQATANEYKTLFQNRIELLNSQGLFPSMLTFFGENWADIQSREAAVGSKPPIIVPSSNRADWIKKNWDRIKDGKYDNVNDERALANGASPWYAPKRIQDSGIHVYIIVHALEYAHYCKVLDKTGMQVIGWSFVSQKQKSCTGLGAGRYAAVEFCKYIFNNRIAKNVILPDIKNQKAWLVDDDVIYVNSFPGFKDVVDILDKDDSIWGVGFSGAVRSSTGIEIKNIRNTRFQGDLSKAQKTGVLQQCMLLNIGQLHENRLNFSPYFIQSHEDKSFSSFLGNYKLQGGQRESKIRIATEASVVKAEPENGGSENIAHLITIGSRTQVNFYSAEKRYPIVLLKDGAGLDLSIDNLVVNYILPNAQKAAQNEFRMTAELQAIEQIMAKLVAEQPDVVPEEIFYLHEKQVQSVIHIDTNINSI